MCSKGKLVLVTGASGAIGSTLIRHLVESGYNVRALIRGAASANKLPKGVNVIQGDITDARALQIATAKVECVFHLAAKLHINNPTPDLRDEYEKVNVGGTRLLVEAAGQADVKRFVFFSTINVYGASRQEDVFNENSPLNPDSWYAETKARGEEIVLGEMPDAGVILRSAAVYGRGMKGNYARLLNALRGRRFVMIGDGHNRRTIIHETDVCRAAVIAAEHPSAINRIYNATDGRIYTLQEIIYAMCVALGRTPPRLRVPAHAARTAAGFVERGLGSIGRRSIIERAMIDKLLEDVAVSGDKLRHELGYKPYYDLCAGWKQAVGCVSP